MFEKKSLYEIIRFGVTGSVATLVHYAVYLIARMLISASFAFSLGYVISFVLNYFMSARFTFRKKTSKKNVVGFCFAHLINYLLQISLLNVFIYLGVPERVAPIPVYCVSIPVNFLVVRFVFSRSNDR